MWYTATDREQLDPIERHVPRAEVPGLTGLRFVAAFSVAVAHGSQQILRFDDPSLRVTHWIPHLASLGMGLFFVLSGFVIHYNYRIAVTQGGANGLGGFVWARFSRLYPLYFLIVTLDILLGRPLFELMAGRGGGFGEVLHALPYYLTFTQSWVYSPAPDSSLVYMAGPNAALTWSVSTEWFFYLSFPLVALFVVRARRPVAAIVAALLWCVIWITLVTAIFDHSYQIDAWAKERYGVIAAFEGGAQDTYFRWLMYFSPYLRVGEFILGCLIAQLYVLLQDSPPGRLERSVGRALLLIGIASVPMLYAANWVAIRKLDYNFGLAPSVAIIIFCAARYDTVVSRLLNSRPFVALGEASYSIYLTHFLIFILSSSFLGDALPPTMPNVIFLVGKYLFLLGLILLVSLGLHAYVELPTRRWLRGLWRETPGRRKRIAAYSVFASPAVAAALVFVAAPTDSTASIASGIRVLSATYGANCKARRGNATASLRNSCNGKNQCDYVVDVDVLGDSAPGCAKDFTVEYQCAPDDQRLTMELPGEAGLKSPLPLSCSSALASDSKPASPASAPSLASAEPHAAGAASVPPPTAAVSNIPTATPKAGEPKASAAAKTATAADTKGANGIRVRSATYGKNCGAPLGNATNDVEMSCNGDQSCTYIVDARRLGDPAAGCSKDFTVEYECAPGAPPMEADVAGEAGLGKSVQLSCGSDTAREPSAASDWTGIRVLSATYGGNCGAQIGNVTGVLGRACGGKTACDYRLDVKNLGDRAPGCAKSFFVKYQCGGESAARTAGVPGEAGLGKSVDLSCPSALAVEAKAAVAGVDPHGSIDAEPKGAATPAPAVAPIPAEKAAAADAKSATAAANPKAAGEIRVRSATYGENCGAPIGNATNDVRMTCDGDRVCTYTVDTTRLGDPAPGCGKNFTVEYGCGSGGNPLKADVPGEAGLQTPVELSCRSNAENETPDAANWSGIRILSATYGGSCGAPIGNATNAVSGACGSKPLCDYTVDVNKLGDPAPRCAKSFFVKYRCGGESSTRTAALPGEAGLGTSIHLSCR